MFDSHLKQKFSGIFAQHKHHNIVNPTPKSAEQIRSILTGIMNQFEHNHHDTLIPGVGGKIFIPSDKGYEGACYQYATTSHPKKDMSPNMICYPVNNDDIMKVIKNAKDKSFYEVTDINLFNTNTTLICS